MKKKKKKKKKKRRRKKDIIDDDERCEMERKERRNLAARSDLCAVLYI
jgi:hypothetical protein